MAGGSVGVARDKGVSLPTVAALLGGTPCKSLHVCQTEGSACDPTETTCMICAVPDLHLHARDTH